MMIEVGMIMGAVLGIVIAIKVPNPPRGRRRRFTLSRKKTWIGPVGSVASGSKKLFKNR